MKKILAIAIALCFSALVFADNEGNLSSTITISKGNFRYNQQIQSYLFNVNDYNADQGVFSVSVFTNRIPILNVTTPHYCFFRNVDVNTNVIFITLTMRLEPGDLAVLPVSTTNMPCWFTNGITTNAPASLQYGVFSK